MLDRFVANYWLDPVSVRYAGSPGWLKIALLLLPQPDIVLTLDADASVLRSRKGELTLEQINEQQARLRSLPALARRRVNLDAALPPDTLVRQTLTLLEDTSL